MKVEESKHGDLERRVVTAMVTDPVVLARLSLTWRPDLFDSKWANLIGKWCVDHQSKHGGAPGKGIVSYFSRYAEKHPGHPNVDLVERFLAAASEDFESAEPVNPSLMVDEAGHLFHTVGARRAVEKAQAHLEAGDPDAARTAMTDGTWWVETGARKTIDFFLDGDDSWANPENEESLIDYPEPLKRWFHGYLTRDSFVSLFAPIKSGKSFLLVDMAFRAACQRRRVAYFDVGDNSEAKFRRRLNIRCAARPTRSKEGFPCAIEYPIKITPPSTNHYKSADDFVPAECRFKRKTFKRPLDGVMAKAARAKVMEYMIKSKKRSYLKCEIHANGSINVEGIRTILRRWQIEEDWAADVIVIDYADILAPPSSSGKFDKRDQHNATWMELRRMAQETHALVITASQTNKESFSRVLLDRRNFSEDLRKMAHATGVMGLNVIPSEKRNKVMRFNWVVGRDEEYSPSGVIHVAQCLDLAQPCVMATFPRREKFASGEGDEE